jgi:hypothetical protein
VPISFELAMTLQEMLDIELPVIQARGTSWSSRPEGFIAFCIGDGPLVQLDVRLSPRFIQENL